MSSKKDRISEDKLLKALAELKAVAKGDPLEEADPEGGLSTEGEPLSEAAPRGRGEQTKKSRRASASSPFGGSSSSSSSSSSDGAESSDEDDGDDGESFAPPPAKSKKKGKEKVSKAARSASSSAASSMSSDEGSDDGSDDAEKSFREMADEDETMSKGLLVNEFLESMVDQLSLALLHVKETLSKSIQDMEKRVVSQIEGRIAKSDVARRNFEARLAKGVAVIGTAVQDDLLPMTDMIKSISNQGVPSPRGKAVLNKSEVNNPPWGVQRDTTEALGPGGASDDAVVAELRELPLAKINDWLFRKSASGQFDEKVLIAFEADSYDPAFLPSAVRKAMHDDLFK